MSNIRTQIGKIVGKTLNNYHERVKPKIDELKFKEEYQGRIIDCMIGEVDDNYIETPETDEKVVKLEHSKDGVVKIARIKGKTILVDEEGNETDTPGEGCKLVSVGEEDNKLIILSKNRNLFDSKQVKENYCLLHNPNNSVYESPNGNYCVSDFIKLPSNANIKISSLSWARVYLYNEKKQMIDFIIGQENQRFEFNMGQSCFVRLSFVKSELDTLLLTINTSNTEYVQHKYHKTEILLDEPLRSLPDGTNDEIVGNKLIKRVEKVILDGSEKWALLNSDDNENMKFYITFNGNQTNDTSKRTNVLCDRFKGVDFNFDNTGIDVTDKHIRIRMPRILLETEDVKGFKKWLSENNLTIIYELAEPVIIEMSNTLTLQGFDDTTMYIENEITPTVSYGYNALIPYKQELLNQQEEVETNTLDIEQNIIPYLMDMEFNLMLMEDE